VSLIPSDHDPVSDPLLPSSSIVTTDTHGSYVVIAPDSGYYTIDAVSYRGTRSIRFNVKAVRESVTVVPVDTLHTPGALRLPLPEESEAGDGYVYVPGSFISAVFTDLRDKIEIDSVPAGILPAMFIAWNEGIQRKVIRYDIQVMPGETMLIANTQWSHRRKMCLNTSSTGAGVAVDVYNFPLLVRLHSGNFDFSDARADGGGLLFTGHDGAVLSFGIERWDPAGNRAEIWVKVDTIRGDDSVQTITMY
jgi:hypothetical protein